MEYTPQELALTIRKLIESHPDNWRQAVWYGSDSYARSVERIRQAMEEGACGTTACVAGWAAILISPKGTKLTENSFGDYDSIILPGGRIRRIGNVAKDALGLSGDEAEFLFDSMRTRKEVVSILTAIENGFSWYRQGEVV